ncbi:MAG: recombinase RecT [Actinomycetaceae bacterium]
MTTDLTIHEDQTFWTDRQQAALNQLGIRAGNADLAVFFHQAVRTGLDPFARQIYMIERQGKQTIQTGIDGFRLIARRATDAARATFGYEDTLWCGDDGQWRDVWTSSEPPAAAKVTVVRNGERFPAVALFSEYAGRKRDGSLTGMWATKGALMLAKCAEALALRKAFPQDLSGLYTSDEMQQADHQTAAPADAGRARSGTSRLAAAVTPAEPVEAEAEWPPVAEAPAQEPSEAARRKMFAVLKDAGFTDRDAILTQVSQIIGRDVASSSELDASDVSAVVDALSDEQVAS